MPHTVPLKKALLIGQLLVDPYTLTLPSHSAQRQMYRDMFKWTHVEYKGQLIEEATFFSDRFGRRHHVVWDMPSFSTVFMGSEIHNADPSLEILTVNYLDPRNWEEKSTDIRAFAPDMIFLSTTFMLKLDHLVHGVKRFRALFPDEPIVLGGHFIHKELNTNISVETLAKHLGNNIIIDTSLFGAENTPAILKQDMTLANSSAYLIDRDGVIHQGSGSPTTYDFKNSVVSYAHLPAGTTVAPIRNSVGCPFACSFCSYHATAGAFTQKDIEVTLQELQQLDAMGVKNIVFIDDTLNVPAKRFEKLLDRMIELGLTNFTCFSFCRCQYLTEPICQKMRQCGFEAVLLGIESGSNAILVNMNKGATTDQYRKGISLLNKYDILTFGAIIIGFPGETEETLEETLHFINTAGLDYVYLQPYYYLHNSPIHDRREEFGLTGNGALWKHASMSSSECRKKLDELIFQVDGAAYGHLENTMWEYVYLRSIGYDRAYFIRYRELVNSLRKRHISGLLDEEKAIDEAVDDFNRALNETARTVRK